MLIANELPANLNYKIFRNEDFIQTVYIYQYAIDILSVTHPPGGGTVITTKSPHYLQNDSRVVLIVDSQTLNYEVMSVATSVSELTFKIPETVNLPIEAEAKALVPVNLAESNFVGGVYNYLTQEKNVSVNASVKTVAGNGLLIITGTKANLEKIKAGDQIRIGTTMAFTPILDVSPLKSTSDPNLLSFGLNCETSLFEIAALVDSASITSSITTQFFYLKTQEKLMQAGNVLSPVSASGNFFWGELILKIESTALIALRGIYPLQVLRSIGSNEEMLLAGTAEII